MGNETLSVQQIIEQKEARIAELITTSNYFGLRMHKHLADKAKLQVACNAKEARIVELEKALDDCLSVLRVLRACGTIYKVGVATLGKKVICADGG